MAVQTEQMIVDRVPPMLPQGKLLIGGKRCGAVAEETIDVLDPATGERIGAIPRGRAADVNAAVVAARRAFATWSRSGASVRERLLLRLADLIERDAEDLARLEALDNGKPVTFARSIDLPFVLETFRYFAGWPSKLEGSVIPLDDERSLYHTYTQRQPIGVVGQIIPWNFPLLMAAWKLAPALAAGCTVVLKPAELTPYTALRLGELIEEAGFPAGVVNIVTGYGAEAGQAIVNHPGIDKIAFTGSTAVGKAIMASAATTLKRVTLELGGKSPTIIMPDADLATAVPAAAQACFFNSGQLCFAGTRLFAPRAHLDAVLEGVAATAVTFPMGPGLDEGSLLGPLISEKQMGRVVDMVDEGRRHGAAIYAGGKRHGERGWFVEPTIAVTDDISNPLFRDEVFGPVLTVTAYDDVDEVVGLANATDYGLGAVVYTRDLSQAHLLARRIEAGTIWVNCELLTKPGLPFGGFKQSGVGRENGAAVLDHYTELKSVCIRLGDA